MSDPAIEAMHRVLGEMVIDHRAVAVAREALKPIRELCDGMRDMFGDDFEIHISDLAELIYPTEELP